MASVTYVDVIVFNERLIAAAISWSGACGQIEFSDLNGTWSFSSRILEESFVAAIPLEDQAFKLDALFAEAG